MWTCMHCKAENNNEKTEVSEGVFEYMCINCGKKSCGAKASAFHFDPTFNPWDHLSNEAKAKLSN